MKTMFSSNKTFFAICGFVLLCTAISVMAAPGGADEITVDAVRYRIVKAGIKAVVIPAELSAVVSRDGASPVPDCSKFDADMNRIERLLSRCKPGPQHSDSACIVGKQGADALRAPDFTADVAQLWRLENTAGPGAASTDRIAQAVAAQTGLPPSRVIVELAFVPASTGISANLVATADSWAAKLADVGLSSGRVGYDEGRGLLTTSGRDIACDLLAGRASIGMTAPATLQLNTLHVLDAKASWAIREAVNAPYVQPTNAPLVKAAIAGARLARAIHAARADGQAGFDDLVVDLFSLLYDGESVDIKEVESFEAFDRANFRQDVRLDIKINAAAK